MPASGRTRVWPPLVRATHWVLAVSVLIAFFTGHGGGAVHEWAGYVALACVVLRIVLGFTGSDYVRFSSFIFGPKAVAGYVASLFSKKPDHYVGHNPLGGWMIVVLLAVTFVASLSGVLYITDAYWGDPLVGGIHEASGESIIWFAGLHVFGVIVASAIHRENLIASMVHGDKQTK
jgi:cytochrome b